MQPVKRGKRRRKKMPYLFLSGCAVNSCMTVIGNNGALQETIKLRQQSATVSLGVGVSVGLFLFLNETALEKQQHKTKSKKKEG